MFDHHTTPAPCQSSLDEMRLVATRRVSPEEEERYQEAIFRLVGALPQARFQVTSSGAEAIQQVLFSCFLEKARKEGKTHFITSCIEDAPLLQMMKRCEELGCTVHIVPVEKSGQVDLAALKALVTPRTALISLSMAHGLTGVIQPYEEIGRFAQEKGILFHLDVSWGLGKILFSFADLPVDYLTFSGSWIHSIPASGGIFAKPTVPLVPLIVGSPPDLPTLAALSSAARLALLALDGVALECIRLRDLFEEELIQKIPGVQILFCENRLPNVTVALFPRVHHEALAYFLERRGLYPNQSGMIFQKLDKLLAASQIKTESALSFSFSRMTTEAQVKEGARLLTESIAWLQKMSEDVPCTI
ncbi:MAG: aminotransferase class V-fold PLP-dependent enzyme [Verrucomicrobiota bacterium]|nr:aminotransferase class V-fold PLP-dependent enzyme [Verrucomicrobiota bacterium]